VKLRAQILFVFAATLLAGMVLLHFASRRLLLSRFLELETEEIQQDVGRAVTALYLSYNALSTTTSDYAYWDRTYTFMADPKKGDISGEFQNGGLEDLAVNLVVIADRQNRIVFAKAYDTDKHVEIPVDRSFLEVLFAKPQLQAETIASMPLDGIAVFPDGLFLVSTRPILNSARKGESRGVFLFARRFDEAGASQITDLTQNPAKFERVADKNLPPDFAIALASLRASPNDVFVERISEESIGGYVVVPDFLGDPLLILRVEKPRPIYARGVLSQRYMFAGLFGAGLCSC
jgi:sensor domain CHASE-containing protein